MKCLLAFDKFKGTYSSKEIGTQVRQSLHDLFPNLEVTIFPISDGGEGYGEIRAVEEMFKKVETKSVDALHRPIQTHYFDSNYPKIFNNYIVESAQCIGLGRLDQGERNVWQSSSYGLGLILKEILQKGVKHIELSLGGSATVDGGLGMILAMGAKAYDVDGNELKRGTAKELTRLRSVKTSYLKDMLAGVGFSLVVDVVNPLLGENGAVYTYAKQKGASDSDLPLLETAMSSWVDLLEKASHKELRDIPGSGAAGGLGLPILAFGETALLQGIDVLYNEGGLRDAIAATDFLITGEGAYDNQSNFGKAPSKIAHYAKQHNRPIYLLAGRIESDDLSKFQKGVALDDHDQNLKDVLQTLLQDNLKKGKF